MNAQRVPISQLLTDKSSIDDDPNAKKTREDWRKAKELEEARKAGNAPAAVDEEGKCRQQCRISSVIDNMNPCRS